MCVPNADLRIFDLYQSSAQFNCSGGGKARGFMSLQQLYKDAKSARSYWNVPTDGFDLVKYKQAKLYLYPHPSLTYIFHWETDYRTANTYAWPWYHPSELMNRSQHVIVWSKSINPREGTKKLVIKPPATFNDQWYFMRDFYKVGLFTYQVQTMDLTNPFIGPDRVTACITLPFSQSNDPTHASGGSIQNYIALKDRGDFNGVNFGDPNPERYDTALSKGIPYYISLWGVPDTKVWIWSPYDWENQDDPRYWYRLTEVAVNSLIRSGPFASKGVRSAFSVFMKYKVDMLFGGPSATENINPGTDPGNIPPGNQASKNLSGLQIRDPETVGAGVMHPWDVRRGILTARGFQRLTELSPTEIHGGQRECGPLLSEEEASEEDSPWEQTSEEEE